MLAQERGGDLSQMLRKGGFLGECGGTKGKFRGVVTLPQSHTGHLQARLSGLGCPTSDRAFLGSCFGCSEPSALLWEGQGWGVAG